MVVKFGRLGENVVLADFSTGLSRTFRSSGQYVQDGFTGSPKLAPVSVISVTQFGSKAIIYHADSGQQKVVDSAMSAVIAMRGVQGLMYPLKYEGKTPKGTKYKQFIYCCSANVDTLEVYNSL